MVLPAPNLDDRTFQDIVDEAKRLIPRYTPEWTNHNLSDPGVALIELFAWMSEMVLFRVNQVPDRLFVHFLNLVGIEPFPPSVARADVTFWLSAAQDATISVPAGMQVTTARDIGGESSVVFTTVNQLDITPPELTVAMTSDARLQRLVDVTDDLRYTGGSVDCFSTVDGSGHLVPGDALLLGFAHSLAGVALRLSVAAVAQGIGVDPLRPPLAWEVWNGEAWIAADVFTDTTGGLNRSGEIVLMVPAEHESLTLGETSAYWIRVRLTPAQPGQPMYQEAPRIDDLRAATIGATVRAEHASPSPAEILGRSDGSPGQEFRVSFPPILPRRHSETVQVTDPDGSTDWTEVEDFSRSGPSERHFVWDSASGEVRFGPRIRYADGSVRQHGMIPRDGAEIAVTGYRFGGGAAGNVGARTLTAMRTSVPYISGCVNLRAATGRGPVRLLVVPAVRTDPRAQQLDDYALAAPLMRRITEHLDRHRIVGTAIEVGTPYYQGVSVAALVHAPAGRPLALVRQRAIDERTRYINPLTGGADGAGWLFDVDLNAAASAQLLESVEGVDRVDEVQLYEFDLRTR